MRDLGDVDGRQLAQALTELPETGLHELLALERGLVLAVLAKVAHLDRFPDLIGQGDVELELELLDLVPELLLQRFDHGAPDFVTTIKGDARPGAGRRMIFILPRHVRQGNSGTAPMSLAREMVEPGVRAAAAAQLARRAPSATT